MNIHRVFTKAGTDPFEMFEYEMHQCKIVDHKTGDVKFEMSHCIVPAHWSKNARDVLISKYFRKGGVPERVVACDEINVPDWLQRHEGVEGCEIGPEVSVRQVIRRIVGHWTYVGYKNGYFNGNNGTDKNARAYYDEMVYMMLAQKAAPNSPQWFNTGIFWAYGIKGPAAGHWRVDLVADTKGFTDCHVDLPKQFQTNVGTAGRDIKAWRDEIGRAAKQTDSAYEFPQPHACFILNIEDTLMGEEGIVDWYEREARIFKFGSGAGVNVSNLRAKNEPLSSGGKSSGTMSWVEVADRSAGAIKSGGATRRAAKMVVMDLDHPDIVEFITCKTQSELAVASMVTGSEAITACCQAIIEATSVRSIDAMPEAVQNARDAGVPDNYILKAQSLGGQGIAEWPGHAMDTHFESEAYHIASYQNANHSVRIPSQFYEAADEGGKWALHWRTSDTIAGHIDAKELEDKIAFATWFAGDPGVQFCDTINAWNVTPQDGPIRASNPCGEHQRPDNSACNLASLRLTAFLKNGDFDWFGFQHAVHLWMVTLDISITMASLPDRNTAINTYLWRDTGLGYCDLGALLMSLGVPYDSDLGRAWCSAITATMQGQAFLTSAEMAESLGAYPRWHVNQNAHMACFHQHQDVLHPERQRRPMNCPPPFRANFALLDQDVIRHLHGLWQQAEQLIGKCGLRNAEMTVLAPTGTISIVMDCETTGVEPMFSLATVKTLVGGGSLHMQAAKCVEDGLRSLFIDNISADDLIKGVKKVPGGHESTFATAMDSEVAPAIHWTAHVQMMAAAQSFISGAISKTINLPADASVDMVRQAYRMGHDTGCKAIAIYRDQSKLSQPLSAVIAGDDKRHQPASDVVHTVTPPASGRRAERSLLGIVREPGIDIRAPFAGANVYVRTVRYADGRLGEVWVTYSGDEGIINALLTNICKTFNIAVQYGTPPEAILDSWTSSKFDPKGMVGHPNIKTATSILNLAARIIKFHEFGETGSHILNVAPSAGIPDDAIQALEAEIAESPEFMANATLTGMLCPACGSHKYMQTGAGCSRCLDCGHAGGCG